MRKSNIRGALGEKLQREFPSMVFIWISEGVLVLRACCRNGPRSSWPTATLPDMASAVDWARDHQAGAHISERILK